MIQETKTVFLLKPKLPESIGKHKMASPLVGYNQSCMHRNKRD
jgi:hypothetical protein